MSASRHDLNRSLSGTAARRLRDARARGDYKALIDAIPFARFLGLAVVDEGDARRYVMPYRDTHVGNAAKPALHGGTVAGVLELAMQLETLISQTQPRLPDPVDFTIDYWRAAELADCHVAARVIRAGRAIAQVQAECWQGDRGRPIAFARGDFVLRAAEASALD
ncbi:PaaI family thioesterase [Salinisphaera sp.]|uniref:PaaI family thioesterase n=1 Tax=Salinisphaera sp. TaxID=1914330 RepID=UPI002D7859F1|nr:PaaI family thioesterase [Salinisphaera sp.]HET7314605.1 PaaI family thioesterase [Salinisphaera sp.]